MIRSEKKLKALADVLNKGNNNTISSAIEMLREEQPFEGAIGLLTACYDQTKDSTIRKSIEGFLNDLKDQTASVEVIAEIRKTYKPETTSMLISSCWQSGLDYSEYSVDLVNTFLKSDYVGAVECLTVIEESANELSTEKKEEIRRIIFDNPVSPRNEIVVLVKELLTIIEK